MAKKRLASPEHADTLSLKALRELVTDLVDEVRQLSAEVTTLRAQNAALRVKTMRRCGWKTPAGRLIISCCATRSHG